jgi:YD repeat-containing protein
MEGAHFKQGRDTAQFGMPEGNAYMNAGNLDAYATRRGAIHDRSAVGNPGFGILPDVNIDLGRRQIQVGLNGQRVLRPVEQFIGREPGCYGADTQHLDMRWRSPQFLVRIPPRDGHVHAVPREQPELQRNRDGSEVTTLKGAIVKVKDRVGNVTEFRGFDKDGNPNELSRTNQRTGQTELWQKDERGAWRQFVHDNRTRGLIDTGRFFVGSVRADRDGNVTYTGEGGKYEVKHKSDGARVFSEPDRSGTQQIRQVVRTNGIVLDISHNPTGEISEFRNTNSRNGQVDSWSRGADGQWHQKDSTGRPTGRSWNGVVSIDEHGNFRAQTTGSNMRTVYRTDGSTGSEFSQPAEKRIGGRSESAPAPMDGAPKRQPQPVQEKAEGRGGSAQEVAVPRPAVGVESKEAKKESPKGTEKAADKIDPKQELLKAETGSTLLKAIERLEAAAGKDPKGEAAALFTGLVGFLKGIGTDLASFKQLLRGMGEEPLSQDLKNAVREIGKGADKSDSPKASVRRIENADGSTLDVNAEGKVIGIKNANGKEFKFGYGPKGELAEVTSLDERWTRQPDGTGWVNKKGAVWKGKIEVDKDGNLQFTGEDKIAIQHRLNGEIAVAYPNGERLTKLKDGYMLKEYAAPDKSAVAMDTNGRVTYVTDGGQPPKERKFFYNKDSGELEAIMAIDGQVWRKTGPGMWQSNRQKLFRGALSVDKDGLIHYLPAGGNPVVLRRDGKLQSKRN